MEEIILNFLLDFVKNYPWASILIFAMGLLRAIFKPAISFLDEYVAKTPSKDDDVKLAKFKASKAYAIIVWLIDYFASVKIKK